MNLQKFAGILPDIPRWVETRSMLLAGRCEVLGAQGEASRGFVVRGLSNGLIGVVGHPSLRSLHHAVAKSEAEVEVLAMPENEEHVAEILKDWRRSPAILHQLTQPIEFRNRSAAAVRFIEAAELDSLKTDSPDLADELLDALEFTKVAAVIVDDRPVSFCYAGSETETLWDISIDTLPTHRQRGYAQYCASFLIDFMAKRGKQPVWGAEESNIASLGLAHKMRFRPVDRLLVFRGF